MDKFGKIRSKVFQDSKSKLFLGFSKVLSKGFSIGPSKVFHKSFEVVARILPSHIKGGELHPAVSSEAHQKKDNKGRSRLIGGGGRVYTLSRREINRTNFLRQYVYLLLCFNRVHTLQHTIPPGSRVGRMEVRLLSGDRSRRYQECDPL